MLFVRYVIQVVLGRPLGLLTSIFPYISCCCDVLYLTKCPMYCNFLVLNCRAIYPHVLILFNTSSLIIFSVHGIFNTVRYIGIIKASHLDNNNSVIVHVSARYNSVGQT